MKDTYTYRIGDNLYINLTNRCSNRCTFCVRNGKTSYEGYELWLKEGEPSVDAVIAEIGDPMDYNEIVFCGFGEPTYRLDAMLKIAAYVRENGGKTRLNTNGHGNLIHGKNIAPDIAEAIDGINISLNASTAELYNQVCMPQVVNAFDGLLDFAKALKAAGGNCWFSVVDCIGEEQVAACQALADQMGIPLKVRDMIE